MAIDAIGIVNSSSTAPPASASISVSSFLQILLTQLQFQDPLKPVDDEQFMAQLAQFSALEVNQQISDEINNSLSIQASQQAIGLIGKNVQINSTSTGSTASTAGTVTAVSFATGAAQLTVTTSSSNVLTNVQLSDVTLVQ
jgi:flagellar basal-body rod modification protein FlgD